MHPIPGYPVTTPYGVPGSWAAGYHTGEDYSTHGKTGVPVRASRGGRVKAVGSSWGDAYGLTVVVEGRLRKIQVGYCHLSRSVVQVGQTVRAGQVLAYSGNSGRSTGPHLHYEERRSPYIYGACRRPRFSRSGAQTLARILRRVAQRT